MTETNQKNKFIVKVSFDSSKDLDLLYGHLANNTHITNSASVYVNDRRKLLKSFFFIEESAIDNLIVACDSYLLTSEVPMELSKYFKESPKFKKFLYYLRKDVEMSLLFKESRVPYAVPITLLKDSDVKKKSVSHELFISQLKGNFLMSFSSLGIFEKDFLACFFEKESLLFEIETDLTEDEILDNIRTISLKLCRFFEITTPPDITIAIDDDTMRYFSSKNPLRLMYDKR